MLAAVAAHFAIWSSTKLATECAIGLADAVNTHGQTGISKTFAACDEARRVPVQITQRNAGVSLARFEHVGLSRYPERPARSAMGRDR